MLLNDRKVGEVLNRLSRYYGRTILFGKEIGEYLFQENWTERELGGSC